MLVVVGLHLWVKDGLKTASATGFYGLDHTYCNTVQGVMDRIRVSIVYS